MKLKICPSANQQWIQQDTHHSSKVDGHQWMAGQEEVIQPYNVAEV